MPTALVLAVAVGLRRRRGGHAAPWRTALLDGALVGWAIVLVVLTLSARDNPAVAPRAAVLTPFEDLVRDLRRSQIPLRSIGGNVLLFLPLGLLAGLRRLRGGVLGVAALGLLFSAGIELTQYGLDIGRVASIDDVLLNVVGVTVGAAIGVAVTQARDPDTITRRHRGRASR